MLNAHATGFEAQTPLSRKRPTIRERPPLNRSMDMKK